jgi:hypothetical protein
MTVKYVPTPMWKNLDPTCQSGSSSEIAPVNSLDPREQAAGAVSGVIERAVLLAADPMETRFAPSAAIGA